MGNRCQKTLPFFLAISNGSEHTPAAFWFSFPDTVEYPYFLFVSKMTAMELRILFQKDSFPVLICSSLVFYENISILFQSPCNIYLGLSSSPAHLSTSLNSNLTSKSMTSSQSALAIIHPVCLCLSLSSFVSLPLPPSSHLTFLKIWMRTQECDISGINDYISGNAIIGVFHSRNTGLIEVREIKKHSSSFGFPT